MLRLKLQVAVSDVSRIRKRRSVADTAAVCALRALEPTRRDMSASIEHAERSARPRSRIAVFLFGSVAVLAAVTSSRLPAAGVAKLVGALGTSLAGVEDGFLTTAVFAASFPLALLAGTLFEERLLPRMTQVGSSLAQHRGRPHPVTGVGVEGTDRVQALTDQVDQLADRLQRAQSDLEALTLKDPLTGLLNHRAFKERASQELHRAERERSSLAIVALDVDGFKEINERWGHACGDHVLRGLAQAIRSELRSSDICGRVAGDEFMLGIVHSDVADALGVVDRLRKRIDAVSAGPGWQALTISAGVSEFPRHGRSREELMHLADGAMYWAKSSGRNRSCVYSPERDSPLSPQEAAERASQEGLVNTVHALANAVDAKDGYTHLHSQRVAGYAALLAADLGLCADSVEKVRTAGVLHDVGKIGISDALLLKPTQLTAEETREMRRHSELGRDIIGGAGMTDVSNFVLYLHERFDGGGYPAGIAGARIPLESRILHVADTFEAMTSSRVYRKALPVDTALEELERHSGTQFDPMVCEAMVELVRSGRLHAGVEERPTDAPTVLATFG